MRCNIWHVAGRDRDLLVDTGMGVASIVDAVGELFTNSVTAVATHGHLPATACASHAADRRG